MALEDSAMLTPHALWYILYCVFTLWSGQ